MGQRRTYVVVAAVMLFAASVAIARPVRTRVPSVTNRQVRQSLLPVVVRGAQVPGVRVGTEFFPQSVASGDPTSDSVILWTRVEDSAAGGADLPVRLIVTRDRFFHEVVYNRVVTARADADHTVKVKVRGLQPGTPYLYFFAYAADFQLQLSQLGHTRTAPAPDADVAVRFATVNCQDYIGRYYNTYLKLLIDHQDDLDFVLHLGDYIYETTGDPSFQSPAGDRKIEFSEPGGAIELGDPQTPYLAASSLSNYRDIYRTYRSDPMLQQVHERFPMVVIWDDHEYSDDAHGAVATYFDGRRDEQDEVRKRNAERAFFEYVPIDYGVEENGELAVPESMLFPATRIYRDLRFGSNLHLVLTDYRTFRPDHLIAEDAFPGGLALDRSALQAMLGEQGYAAAAPGLDPYVRIEDYPAIQPVLTAVVTMLYLQADPQLGEAGAVARAQAAVTGNFSTTYANALFAGAQLGEAFPPEVLQSADRGVSYLLMGKRELFSSTGSRYMIGADPYRLFAAWRNVISGGAAESAYGPAQSAWLASTLAADDATWTVLGSSTSMTPMVLDLSHPEIAPLLPPSFPDAFRGRLLVNVDQWDGFPDTQAQVVGMLAQLDNAVIVSGDIHAAFAAVHPGGVWEFTGPAVSSGTLGDLVLATVLNDPQLGSVPGIEGLVGLLGTILQVSSLGGDTPIVDQAIGSHGFVVLEAGAEALKATYYLIDGSEVATSYYDMPAALEGVVESRTFTVTAK